MIDTTRLRGLPGLLARVGAVARLAPARPAPVPAYTTCHACGKAGRDDQRVPDPEQFTAEEPSTGRHAARELSEVDLKLVDAAPVWCGPCRRWFHAIGCYTLHRHA